LLTFQFTLKFIVSLIPTGTTQAEITVHNVMATLDGIPTNQTDDFDDFNDTASRGSKVCLADCLKLQFLQNSVTCLLS
jgi:hypothetical protein